VSIDRRAFLRWIRRGIDGAILGSLGLIGARRLRAGLTDVVPAPPAQQPIRPPGALPEAEFRATCTRCFLCAQVCPPQCIVFPQRIEGSQPPLHRAPGALERHELAQPVWDGGDTPWILPWERACTLCMECGEICPTGALVPIAEERQTIHDEVRMGMARIDRKICLPWTRTSWCGA